MKNIYFITGASKGLGESFAKTVISSNNIVHCFSRSENEKLQQLANESNCKFVQHAYDVSDYDKVEVVINQLLEEINWSEADSFTLINNAGILNPISPIGNQNEQALLKNIDVNLKAPMFITELIISKIQQVEIQKFVLNISSGAGRNPYHGWASYCTSKAGLDMFTKCVGLEQRDQKHPVKIIAFAPGVVDTNMQDQIRSTPKDQFKNLSKFIDLKNDGLLLDPNLVAKKLLSFMISNQTETGGCYDIREFS